MPWSHTPGTAPRATGRPRIRSRWPFLSTSKVREPAITIFCPPSLADGRVARRCRRCRAFCGKNSSGVPRTNDGRKPLGGVRGVWDPKKTGVRLASILQSIRSQVRRLRMGGASGFLLPLLDEAIKVLTVEEQISQLTIVGKRDPHPRQHAGRFEIAHRPRGHSKVKGRLL